MVHDCSQVRQRHDVDAVMTFASVSTDLAWQKGQCVGRSTG